MIRQLLTAAALSVAVQATWAQQTPAPKPDNEEKMISGMSIVGNNEAPKSLIIVPWKSSEIGQQNELQSSLLDADLKPVDKAVFQRELDFYRLSNPQ